MDKFEKIQKYKELLDIEAITQDEFEEAKKRILKTNAVHEHLDKGARVASSAIDSIKKKTDNAYDSLKGKYNQWVEQELEKERINDNQKNKRKEESKQKRQALNKKKKAALARSSVILRKGVKNMFLGLLIAFVLVIGIVSIYALTREKVSFDLNMTASVHGLKYLSSSQFSERKAQERNKDTMEVFPEKKEYDIYSDDSKLVANYSVEYIGDDVDIDKLKYTLCKNMYKEKVSQKGKDIIIEGYYKRNDISIRNIFDNGIMKGKAYIITRDYSCFVISMRCNVLNYNSEKISELFDSVELDKYTNINNAKGLRITYTGSKIVGYRPVKEDFEVEVEYKNGKKSVPEIYSVNPPKVLNKTGNVAIVECHGIKQKYEILTGDDEDKDVKNNEDALEKKEERLFDKGARQA